MELRIQSINFEATEQLKSFIEKKISKLEKYADIIYTDINLKVVKPETANNKEASVKLHSNNGEFFADKTSDTFEESIDQCIEALEKQISKSKDKKDK